MAGLTRELLSQSRVIAKGARIREVEQLVNEFGGRVGCWVKKSSPTFEQDSRWYEFHWYECHGVGRVEVKLKEVGRP